MISTNQTIALSMVLLAACFNAGPPATLATEATTIFAITPPPSHDDCGNSYYIGSLAIGSGSNTSYLTLVPYEGQNCNNNGGGDSGSPVAIFSFDKTLTAFYTSSNNSNSNGNQISCGGNSGGGGSMVGTLGGAGSECVASAGMQSTAPSVLSTGQWVTGPSNNGQGGGQLALAAVGGSSAQIQVDVSNVTPTSLVLDNNSSTIFIAGWPASTTTSGSSGNFDHDNPQYPGDTSAYSRSSTGGPYALLSIPSSGAGQSTLTATVLSQSIQFFGESVENSLVGNDTDLFFISHSTVVQDGATIGTFPKNGTSSDNPTAIATIDQSLGPDVGPVGLAADNNNVVWTASVDVHSYPEVGCWVFDLPTNAAEGTAPTLLFSTTKFSCADAALDSDAGEVYFAIVSLDSDSNDMHGDGIGRVSLTNPNQALESVAVGMVGDGAGPRRIYLDDGNIYAVDPEVIGKINKASLDGKQDF